VFSYNYFVWTLAFFLGLQFTHMDQGIMQEFTLDWNVMKHWPPILWVVFFALLTFLGAYFKALISLYDAISYTRYYVIWGVLLFGYIFYRSRRASDTHIHHYFLMMIVLSFTCY